MMENTNVEVKDKKKNIFLKARQWWAIVCRRQALTMENANVEVKDEIL